MAMSQEHRLGYPKFHDPTWKQICEILIVSQKKKKSINQGKFVTLFNFTAGPRYCLIAFLAFGSRKGRDQLS